MRVSPLLMVTVLTASTMVLTGFAAADGGVGACVLGNGFSLTSPSVPTPFVGVNVGVTNSTSGAYTTQAQYEAECCAEGDMAPDCFRPPM